MIIVQIFVQKMLRNYRVQYQLQQEELLQEKDEQEMEEEHRRKIGLFCNVPVEAVIEERDVDHSIYEVPLVLREQKVDSLVLKHLKIPEGDGDLSEWTSMVDTVCHKLSAETEVTIVGKYIELHDAYKSIYEALTHAGITHKAQVKFRKVSSERVETVGSICDKDTEKGLRARSR